VRAQKGRVGIITGAAAAAIAVGALLLTGTSEPEPRVEPLAGTHTPGDVAAVAYLDEAERWLENEQYQRALEMLKEAEKVKPADPALHIRFNRLADRAETKHRLAAAQKSIALDEPEEALEHAKVLLSISPDSQAAIAVHEKARAMLVRARVEREAASASPTPTEAPTARKALRRSRPQERRSRLAKLSVAVEPATATLYMDDEFLGKAPIVARTIPEGRHVLEVRATGYTPKTIELEVRARAHENIDVNLVRSTEARLAFADQPQPEVVPASAKVTSVAAPVVAPPPR
jgi:tetratricopeptide (TPR) repeat protein